MQKDMLVGSPASVGKKQNPESYPSDPLMIQYLHCDHTAVLKDSIAVDLAHNQDDVVCELVLLVRLTRGAAHKRGWIPHKRLNFFTSYLFSRLIIPLYLGNLFQPFSGQIFRLAVSGPGVSYK
jgi:hypothetical protein